MAPSFVQNQNKPQSTEPSPTPVGSMPPEVVALICASVLIFLVFLAIGIVLIRRRLHHRTQGTTQVEAQAHLPSPVASDRKEKVVLEDIFSPTSSSSKSSAAAPLLPPITSLSSSSTVMAEDLFKELMSKTSAALSKGDKYTTLPLRRSRQARRSQIVPKNSPFDLLALPAALDVETVNSDVPAGRLSPRSSSMRSARLASDADTPMTTSSHPEPHEFPITPPPNTGDQSAIRPSPTIVSMEARPPEADAAALPDVGTVFVSGSIPSFSSISSAISLPGVCPPFMDNCTTIEGGAGDNVRAGLACETPRQREHRACATETRISGTPPSASASVSSTILTAQDTTFSSDTDSVCDIGLNKMPLDTKAFKLGNVLPLPISTFGLSFDLSCGTDGAVVGLRPKLGHGDLGDLTKYDDGRNLVHDDLTTPAVADASF